MEHGEVDPSGPDGLWDKAGRESAARRQAFKAARDRSAGRIREEVREIYLAELRSRYVPVPSDDVLDRAVDRITGGPIVSARQLGEGLIETGKALRGIINIFRAINRPTDGA